MAIIKIEGQRIEGDKVGITDEIASDDELLRAALAPTWPDARKAEFTRDGGTDGKPLVVEVKKKAGTKGVDNVVEVEEAQERLQAREEAEAERVRKLEDLALAADAFLLVHYEFADGPLDNYVPAISAHVKALDRATENLGDEEIAKIRTKRRGL
jgi:hypothetical protein